MEIDPIRILKESVRRVPSMRYAMALAGLLSVLAIGSLFKLSLIQAGAGVVGCLVLMTTMVVFAKLSNAARPAFRVPALLLLWASVLLVIGSAGLLCSSIFFGLPLDLRPKPASDPLMATNMSDNVKNDDPESVLLSNHVTRVVENMRVWRNLPTSTPQGVTTCLRRQAGMVQNYLRMKCDREAFRTSGQFRDMEAAFDKMIKLRDSVVEGTDCSGDIRRLLRELASISGSLDQIKSSTVAPSGVSYRLNDISSRLTKCMRKYEIAVLVTENTERDDFEALHAEMLALRTAPEPHELFRDLLLYLDEGFGISL